MTTVESARRDVGVVKASSRAQVGVVVMLLVVAGAAWWITAVRMAGMDAGPGTDLGSLGWFTGVWAVMMAAMMLPSFAPTAAAYAEPTGGRGRDRWPLFALGYMLVWCAAGLAAYALFESGKDTLSVSLAWHSGGRWVAAGVLGLAAAYQLTPLKASCLRRCRDPRRFRDDRGSGSHPAAVAAGIRAGGSCIGCSWALMAALFALGVRSLTLIAGLVMIEKLVPWRLATTRVTAAVLVALAVGIAATPGAVPGLVVPGSSAPHAMNGMR
jgi:predicted metal-binding membrane protein